MGLMPDQAHTEPTNAQLANFLVVYAKRFMGVGGKHLSLDASTLERMMDHDNTYREDALKTHRNFQKKLDEYMDKLEKGQMQCEHIRPNGKRCPNFNEPGKVYCGLHKDDE